jgi:hypothetical protein
MLLPDTYLTASLDFSLAVKLFTHTAFIPFLASSNYLAFFVVSKEGKIIPVLKPFKHEDQIRKSYEGQQKSRNRWKIWRGNERQFISVERGGGE